MLVVITGRLSVVWTAVSNRNFNASSERAFCQTLPVRIVDLRSSANFIRCGHSVDANRCLLCATVAFNCNFLSSRVLSFPAPTKYCKQHDQESSVTCYSRLGHLLAWTRYGRDEKLQICVCANKEKGVEMLEWRKCFKCRPVFEGNASPCPSLTARTCSQLFTFSCGHPCSLWKLSSLYCAGAFCLSLDSRHLAYTQAAAPNCATVNRSVSGNTLFLCICDATIATVKTNFLWTGNAWIEMQVSTAN